MKEIVLAFAVAIVGALSLLSSFLYAAFDITWWTPLEKHDVRVIPLVMMHVVAMICGGIGWSYVFWWLDNRGYTE
jgi:hypothetical protein